MSPETLSDPYNILSVDDSPDNLFLIEAILDDPNYSITSVSSGQAALSLLRKAPPDVILLDVMMPEVDGYEVTRIVRQEPDLPYIPILLITAHDQSSLVQGLDAGADDFIRKPVDVNELRARVRSLLRLKRSMDAQTHMMRQRDDFVARLTHDLRTPLVAANRMLKLCRDNAFGPVPGEADHALASIIDSNDHLLNMVNTLLEVYRHEAGHKTLAHAPVNLLELAETVVQELMPLAANKSLTCQLITQPATAESSQWDTTGDYLELRRVVTNLVDNAIKFTDHGGIVVTLSQSQPLPPAVAKQLSLTDADTWLLLAVEDTGIGMSAKDQEAVFQWFRQGKHRRAGHGLGLHLTQRIAKLHGGLIEVTSTLGQGSCFTLYLPGVGQAQPEA
ncbi:MAG: response regulator [Leptolyngbyaceae cyanobacterium SM2_5_2]|nr:response regulator [Leptolyngbyaceae cyanobacterium SM2_5_2]